MLCCGVCQYEGRHCAAMAPPGAMDAHLAHYRQQGFDFGGFSPEELWTRIRGEQVYMWAGAVGVLICWSKTSNWTRGRSRR